MRKVETNLDSGLCHHQPTRLISFSEELVGLGDHMAYELHHDYTAIQWGTPAGTPHVLVSPQGSYAYHLIKVMAVGEMCKQSRGENIFPLSTYPSLDMVKVVVFGGNSGFIVISHCWDYSGVLDLVSL